MKYGDSVSGLIDFNTNFISPFLKSDHENLSQVKGGKDQQTPSDTKNLKGEEGSHGLPCLSTLTPVNFLWSISQSW